MSKESILYGVIGLFAGVIITGFGAAYAVNNDNQGMMSMMGMNSDMNSQGMMDNSDMSMGDMASSLKNKTGDDFDKAFISGMVAHHQGAIDMANLAEKNANHDEIKKLSRDIVLSQTNEINEMKAWQTKWGYGSLNTKDSSHTMMGN